MTYNNIEKVSNIVLKLLNNETYIHHAGRRTGKTTLAISVAKTLITYGKRITFVNKTNNMIALTMSSFDSIMRKHIKFIILPSSNYNKIAGYKSDIFIFDEIYPNPHFYASCAYFYSE